MVHTLEKPSCIYHFERELNLVGVAIFKWTLDTSQPFPCSWDDLYKWHLKTKNRSVSFWLSTHMSDEIRVKFDGLDSWLMKTILRLCALQKRLNQAVLDHSDSAETKKKIESQFVLLDLQFAAMREFFEDLANAFGWIPNNYDYPSQDFLHGFCISVFEKSASKIAERAVVDASRPEETSLPEAALKAIVDGGMAGVLNEAGKLPAAQRHSRTMMEMLAKDARYYWWSAEDWVVHLKSSKPTILETDAWDHIKRWREENKRERLGE
jgi:hypothetical protein